MKRLTLMAMAASALLTACSADKPATTKNQAATSSTAMPADSLYFGGDIITMEGDKPEYVEAVAVKDGKIVFVGSKAQAQQYKGRNTIENNLQGKTLLPGFIDPHGHFMFSLLMVNQVNVSIPPVGTVTDIPSLIKNLQAYKDDKKIDDGEWVVGWGYDQDGLSEQRHVTKLDLDAAFPNNRVMLIHVSGHGAVLNSQALKWANVDANTATPAGGIINRLPGSNEPAGLLMETAFLPIFANLPQPSEADMLELMKPAQMMYASEGYTHAQEGFTSTEQMDFLLKAAKQQRIFLDIVSLPGFTEMDKWMNKPQYVFGEYNNHFKLQGIKFTQDGSPQGKTAHVTTPYLTGGPGGEKNWYGEGTQPKDHFIAQVHKAYKAGLQVFVHSNGDATIDELIEAVEPAGIKAADDRRTIVIHSQFQRPDHLDKYKALGMSPSYFTNHTFFWGDVHVKNIGMKKAQFISPVKASTDKGLIYSNHTDFNITPLNPFFVMWTAMARTTRTGVILGEDQRVDAYTALQGITTGPAWQIFEEKRKGKIQVGLLADFVVLDKNPLKTSLETFRDIKVVETIKEDEVVYRQAK